MKINHFIGGILLVAGTTIGAGMLAIPLVTATAGFLPAFIITFFVWLFMLLTGLLLQFPLSFRIIERTHKKKYLFLVPVTFLRGFARSLGMSLGMVRFSVRNSC